MWADLKKEIKAGAEAEAEAEAEAGAAHDPSLHIIEATGEKNWVAQVGSAAERDPLRGLEDPGHFQDSRESRITAI